MCELRDEFWNMGENKFRSSRKHHHHVLFCLRASSCNWDLNLKISQKTCQTVSYFNFYSFPPIIFQTFQYPWRKMKLTLRWNGRETANLVLEITCFLNSRTALLQKDSVTFVFLNTLSRFYKQLLNKHFGNNHLCVFLIVAVLKAVRNLLRYISAEAHLYCLLSYSEEYSVEALP